MPNSDFSCVRNTCFSGSCHCAAVLLAQSTQKVHRPRSQSSLHFEIGNIYQIRSEKWVMWHICNELFSQGVRTQRVLSHVWMSHVTHVDESCHTYEWVMSHMWMSHVTHVNESCHICEWVMSHVWMSYVTHTNDELNINEGFMCNIWKSHVPHYTWVMGHIWMSYVMGHIWMSYVPHNEWVLWHI